MQTRETSLAFLITPNYSSSLGKSRSASGQSQHSLTKHPCPLNTNSHRSTSAERLTGLNNSSLRGELKKQVTVVGNGIYSNPERALGSLIRCPRSALGPGLPLHPSANLSNAHPDGISRLEVIMGAQTHCKQPYAVWPSSIKLFCTIHASTCPLVQKTMLWQYLILWEEIEGKKKLEGFWMLK